MSIGHTKLSIRPLDEQKCPLDIHMSIRPMDEQKCPFDIQMSIRPLGKQKCPVDIQMSIRPMDEQKCPVDIQMSIGHLAEVLDMYGSSGHSNVHWTSCRGIGHVCNRRTRTPVRTALSDNREFIVLKILSDFYLSRLPAAK